MFFCRKHLYDRIIWLRNGGWGRRLAHNRRLNQPHFIWKYLYLYQEDERSCICLLGVSLSTIFLLDVSTMWYFLFFILIHLIMILVTSFRFASFDFVSIGFVSFRLISFRFVRFRFVSFLFRFALYRYPAYSAWKPVFKYS